MIKLTLEFDSTAEAIHALRGSSYAAAIISLYNHIRQYIKHGPPPDKDPLEEIYRHINNIIDDYQLL